MFAQLGSALEEAFVVRIDEVFVITVQKVYGSAGVLLQKHLLLTGGSVLPGFS